MIPVKKNSKLFHNILISVFIKPEEDFDSIKTAFLSLFPFDLEILKIPVNERNASTFNDRTIKIIEVKLEKNRIINEFMNHISEKLNHNDKAMLVRQLDSRIDDELNFFFRLSKKRLLEDNCFVVVDHGNCFHFKCHIATYPKNKDKAKELLSDFLEKVL